MHNQTPRLIVDLGRVLYVGPWGEAAEHAPMVPILGAGLDGDIQLVIEGQQFAGRTVHIASGVPRSVNAFGGRLAVMPFDPVYATVGELDEPGILQSLETLSTNGFGEDAWQGLAEQVGFQPLERVGQAVRDAASFLDSHHEENAPGEEVAAVVGYSLSHLQELFRNQLGVSMRSYRSWARLRRTAELMATAPTLTDAAVQAGFYDAAHFTRTFTATFGVLPSEVFAQELDVHVVDDPLA